MNWVSLLVRGWWLKSRLWNGRYGGIWEGCPGKWVLDLELPQEDLGKKQADLEGNLQRVQESNRNQFPF